MPRRDRAQQDAQRLLMLVDQTAVNPADPLAHLFGGHQPQPALRQLLDQHRRTRQVAAFLELARLRRGGMLASLCDARQSSCPKTWTRASDTKHDGAAYPSPMSRATRSKRTSAATEPVVSLAPLAPAAAAAAMFPSASRRSCARSSSHRADRRRRTALCVCRRRRRAPRLLPRPAPKPSRTADRPGPRDHRGRLPDRHPTRLAS
jgi:hypothetical protein